MMLTIHYADVRLSDFTKYTFLAALICLTGHSQSLYSSHLTEPSTITYYLYINDFIESMIEIPTSTIESGSPTTASSYLAGRAPLYNTQNTEVGICSASFLCMKTNNIIYNDISNYISADGGLIVTWFTPTTLINLELDSIVNSMVTECTVVVTTKVGLSLFFGETFNLIVSSNGGKIYFQFKRIGTIF